MSITTDRIISIVCQALELDREKLLDEKKQGNQAYRDGRMMAVYIMRQRIVETKCVYSTRGDGTRAYMEVDKPITYKEVAYTLKRKQPQSAMASELACKELLTNKAFKRKYDMVVGLLDGNIDIA